jgi:hypothetical protein
VVKVNIIGGGRSELLNDEKRQRPLLPAGLIALVFFDRWSSVDLAGVLCLPLGMDLVLLL